MINLRNIITTGLVALVLGAGLLPLETAARPSKHKVGPINPEVRAIVEYVINNPTTTVNTTEVYDITSKNCWEKEKQAECWQSRIRNTYNYKFILDGQEVTVSYQDLDSTRIHSDGKISPEDYLFVHQRRNPHQSFPSSTDFTDSGLDGIVDDSFSIFSKEEIGMSGDYAIQKEYELVLKKIGGYISQHPLIK